MNKIYLIVLIGLFFINAKSQTFSDTVYLGSNFNTDIYYNIEDAAITSSPSANNWTLGFATAPTAPSIIINGGKGVKLSEIPSNIMDTSSFENTLDTSNIQQWNQLKDSDTSWYRSAFQQNDLTNPPYGWGVFDNSTFQINGHKIFLVKTQSNKFYKVWIVDKNLGTYRIKYATLNHSFDTIQNIQASNFIQRNFIFLDLDNGLLNNREPFHNNWDLLFSQYQKANGEITVGVKSNSINKSFSATEYKGMQIATSNNLPENATYQNLQFSNKINVTDDNWYEEDNGNIILKDSLTYFIKKDNGDIYKFWFTGFDGNISGLIAFEFEKVFTGTTSLISETINQLNIFPNPSIGIINFNLIDKINSPFTLQIYDIQGKLVHQNTHINTSISLNIHFLSNGVYYLHLSNEIVHYQSKILLNK